MDWKVFLAEQLEKLIKFLSISVRFVLKLKFIHNVHGTQVPTNFCHNKVFINNGFPFFSTYGLLTNVKLIAYSFLLNKKELMKTKISM